ncbi:MAG: FKBP-type peptidyl-prolyl cis-trans isomerase N-terminal domain-containing protein [Pseudomonadota bacterium]
MKNISKLLLAGSMIFLFAQAQAAIAQNVQLNSQDAKLSYTIGYQMGRNFNKQKINVDPEVFAKGLNDGIKQSQPMLNESQMKQVLQQFRSEMMAKLQKANAGSSDKNLQMSQEFLQKNKSKQGVVTLPSGLQYKILKKGEGVSPDLSDVVVVNYEGKLIDG